MIFLAAKQDDLAVKAFERGLVYDEDNPQIPLLLAETLLQQHKGQQALELVDRYHPASAPGRRGLRPAGQGAQGDGPREGDHAPARGGRPARQQERAPPVRPGRSLPRDRPGREGRGAVQLAADLAADARRPTGALAASLLKRKKAGDLLKVFCEAWNSPMARGRSLPQLQAVAEDDALALAMLDAGIEQLSGQASRPSPRSPSVVLASSPAPIARGRPARPARAAAEAPPARAGAIPTPLVYRELAETLRRMDQFADAAATSRR